MAFAKKIFKPCYRCNKHVPPHMSRSSLIDKIIYTLCKSCRDKVEEEEKTVRAEQKEEQDAVTLWTMKKDKEAKRKQNKLDNERFTRLRLVLSGE